MKRKFLFFKTIVFSLLSCMLYSCTEGENESSTVGKASVEIERLDDVTSTSFSVNFKPSDNTTKWVYALAGPNEMEDFVNDKLEGIKTVEGPENLEVTFEDLIPSNIYTVYAKAYNELGEVGSISTIKYPTNAELGVETLFTSATATSVTITFTDVVYRCKYYLGTAEDEENFYNNTIEDIKELSNRTSYTLNYFDLTPETEYVLYVLGYDRSDAVVTKIKKQITTKKESEVPAFRMVADEKNGAAFGIFTIECPEADRLVSYISEKGLNDGLIDGELNFQGNIIKMLDGWAEIPDMAKSFESFNGKDLVMYYESDFMSSVYLKPDEELESYVSVYKDGKVVDLKHLVYKNVEKKTDLEKPVVNVVLNDVKLDENGYYDLNVTVSQNDACAGFYSGVVDPSMGTSKEDIISALTGYAPKIRINNDEILTKLQNKSYSLAYISYKENDCLYTEGWLEKNYDYYFAVLPFNSNGKEGYGDLVYYKIKINEQGVLESELME